MSEEKTETELSDVQKAELFVKNPEEGMKLAEVKEKKEDPKPEATPKPAAKK